MLPSQAIVVAVRRFADARFDFLHAQRSIATPLATVEKLGHVAHQLENELAECLKIIDELSDYTGVR